MQPIFTWYALMCHPATPSAAALQLRAGLHHDAEGLHVCYVLTGELAALRVPSPSAQPHACDGLWQHTCLELFVGAADARAYREFNFSPAGHWAAYAFASERQRAPAQEPLPAPQMTWSGPNPEGLRLQALVPKASLPPVPCTQWLLGLCAVLETDDGRLSYWALHHPHAKPDFHARGGWVASAFRST